MTDSGTSDKQTLPTSDGRTGTAETLIEDPLPAAGHNLRGIGGPGSHVVDHRIRVRTDGRTVGNPWTPIGVLRLRLVPSPS